MKENQPIFTNVNLYKGEKAFRTHISRRPRRAIVRRHMLGNDTKISKKENNETET